MPEKVPKSISTLLIVFSLFIFGFLIYIGDKLDVSKISTTLDSADSQLASVGALEPTSGIVASYTFDEGSGTSVGDSSGNGNTGTLLTGATWATGGQSGGAIDIGGSNGSVNVGSPASLDNLSQITTSAWIYPRTDGEGTQGQVIGKFYSPSSVEGWYLGFDSYNLHRLRFVVDYSTTDLYVVTAPLSLNEWQHITMTWDGTVNASGVHIYRNGVEVSKVIQTSGSGSRISDASRSVLVGSDADNGANFNGLIDEVRLYNRVLSLSEVQNLYSPGTTPPPTPTFDFNMANGGARSVAQGASITNSVSVSLLSGTTQSVVLSVSGLPTGVTGIFAPISCSPACNSTLTLTASGSATVGTNTVTITAV